jgi:formylglycine-generating enzyme
MEDVLKGIAYAHQQKVIHRDLKPANILLFPKSGGGFTAKVSDYGLVKLLGEEFLRSRVTKSVQISLGGAGKHSLGDEKTEGGEKGTSTRALLGTWAYMSPEQQEGAEATERSDVYSLGLMCYQLLTGEKPTLRLPNQLNPKIVSEWNEILLKALENRPENRFADAGEMLKALEPVRKAIHTSAEQKQREKIESEIKAVRQQAARAVQGGDLETALSVLKAAADTYPDHKRLREDVADVQKRIADRESAQRKSEEDKRKHEDTKRRERERSRRRRVVFGGMGGIILLIAMIAGAFYILGPTPPPPLVPDTPTPTPTHTFTPEPTNTPTWTPTPTPTHTPTPVPGSFDNPSHGKVVRVDLGGGVGLELIYIEGGSFNMGQTEKEKQWLISEYGQEDYDRLYNDEMPRKLKRVDGFWMGKHPVTVAQFRQFVNATGHRTTAERLGSGQGMYVNDCAWKDIDGVTWRNPGFPQRDDHPVVLVSWDDAVAFCSWISDRTGRRMTLPTEAQWEYACRAGTSTVFFWSNSPDDGEGYLNAADKSGNPCGEGYRYTHSFNFDDGFIYTSPVGHFKPNAWGLYDMLGNVWEWCNDWYGSDYYRTSPERNPSGPASGSFRVYRGGSWFLHPGSCRPAYRGWFTPGFRFTFLGFRLVAP